MADTPINSDYIQCGFFDAVETSPGVYDRIYDADSWSKPYKRIVSDGIFASQAGSENSDFKVVSIPGSVRQVKVTKGEGIFWTKWLELTADQVVNIDENMEEYSRIDSIIIQIDRGNRIGQVLYRPGVAAEVPVAPELVNEGDIREWRVANINVESIAIEITDSDIVDLRGIETPFIASLIQTLSTEDLFTQWTQMYQDYFNQTKATVEAFLRDLTEDLNVSMTLQEINIVEDIEEDTDTINIHDYDTVNDVIFIEVNGAALNEDDYTIDVTGIQVTFENQLLAGTKVHVKILKSVKAPIAEGRAF